MKKRISILVLLIAVLAGGCTHSQISSLFGRLANFPDHCGFVRGESGALTLGWQCSFETLPFDDFPLQVP